MRTRMRSPGRRRAGTGRRLLHAAVPVVLCLAAAVGTLAGKGQPAAALTPPVVTGGGGHTCALLGDQSVWCWGQNTSGELGDGAKADSLVPVQVNPLPAAIDVAAGYSHTCAVDTTHIVWCWGSNAFGELGNGTTSTGSTAPVQALNVQASQVSAGREASCAVTLAQRVRCWGDNNFGELGDGNFNDSSTPKLVAGLTGVTQVAVGDFHACALQDTGRVFCWGSNTFGDLGDGTTTTSDVPVVVAGIEGAEQIAAGAEHTCALLTGGDLKCWGDNSVGQLGTGNFTDALVPAQVASLSSGVAQMSLGEDFTCALAATPGATVLCWGDAGAHGQLGDGHFSEISPFPTLVFGLQAPPAGTPGGSPVQVALGAHHACAALFTGKVECWGDGFFGSLGDGSMLDRAIPTPTVGLPVAAGSVEQVAVGRWTGCAVTAALNARCWGQAVGNGSPLSSVHTSAVLLKNLPAGQVAQVSAGYGGCALVMLGGLATGLRCWGDNTWGELGNNTTTASLTPVTVQGLPSQIESVTTGGRHTCALVHNGGAWCWGDNKHGDLGDGTTTQRSLPVVVQGLPQKPAQISAGGGHTCALLTGGSVRCWGANSSGQLGNGSTSDSSVPVAVTGLSGAVAVAAGEAFSCALTGAGAVDCWGNNSNGQLGNGSTTDSDVPVQVSGLPAAVAIAAGGQHACALLISGQAACWGANLYGQLGNGSTTGSDVPVLVSGFISDQASISAGVGQSACSLTPAEQAQCWGQNVVGQLGDGTTTNRSTPVAVTGL
jgi:alpha-tubulin suppressor-like RCC1 family protein